MGVEMPEPTTKGLAETLAAGAARALALRDVSNKLTEQVYAEPAAAQPTAPRQGGSA